MCTGVTSQFSGKLNANNTVIGLPRSLCNYPSTPCTNVNEIPVTVWLRNEPVHQTRDQHGRRCVFYSEGFVCACNRQIIEMGGFTQMLAFGALQQAIQ